ncbi:hypothetical protein WMY93_022494 [Mugilogobius chulae]|uniref:SWIM-type domain-containing protein n=1 Tax=Mugilogobius chulae TaxID=88201 RepID=A0AAW0NIB0_9GOBI
MKQLRENGFCIVTAKVLHSQRLSAPPLQPWIIAEANGTVKSAHCTCMAGLGEVCSHVGALLFTVETVARIRDSMTVTQEKAYWLLPSGLKKIEYKPIRLMDFSSAKTKKKRLDEQVHSHCASDHQEKTPPCRPAKVTTPEMTDDELNAFFHQIQICGTKPVILSVIQGFSEAYIPKSLDKKFPPILTNLLDAECFDMEKTELLQKCSELRRNIFITAEQASQVERVSRFQAFSKEWHQFRLGRITASRLKSVCHTTVENPAQSVIKNICNPTKFSTAATRWGCAHEKDALERYKMEMKTLHASFSIQDSGFVINPKYPYMGATPDSLVSCECCGNGCVEVKCPFCLRAGKIEDNLGSKSCLEINQDHKLQLKHTHQYYYQVQCQMFLCERDYCDFVVWTEKDVHFERIEPDELFWQEISSKASVFFDSVILPELVAKFFSRSAVKDNTAVTAQTGLVQIYFSDLFFLHCLHYSSSTFFGVYEAE